MNEAKTDAFQLPVNQVLCGDCVEVMKTFPDESIDMTMFSPPYWGLRDYGISGQIGLEEHPSKYIEKMVEVCQEVKRILKKTGSLYIVIGDTYYGSGVKDPSDPSHGKMTRGSFCAAAKASQAIQNKYQTNWLQPKQLLGIPWRVAIALQDDGWILRNDIIWNKPNHMPSSVTDRLTNAYEHIFHFVKSRKYYYDLDAIREKPTSLKPSGNKERKPSVQPRNTHVGRSIPWSPFQAKKEPYLKNNPHTMRLKPEEHIALDPSAPMDLSHPLGKNPGDVIKWTSVPGQAPQGNFGHGGTHGNLFDHPNGKNPGDFWNIMTKGFKGAHFAVYPEQLCIRPIKSSCPPNGIVLDPMCGTGTTLAVAKKLGRKYIGIELNPQYIEIAMKRLIAIPEKITTFF